MDANRPVPLEYATQASTVEAEIPARCDDLRTRVRRATLALVSCAALVAVCLLGHGWPIDGFTWTVLAATALGGVTYDVIPMGALAT